MVKHRRPWRFCLLCQDKRNLVPGITYHKFPANLQARKLWMQICQLDEEKDDVSNTFLCSRHFKQEDYIDIRAKQLGGNLKLKAGIVPTILTPQPLPISKQFSVPFILPTQVTSFCRIISQTSTSNVTTPISYDISNSKQLISPESTSKQQPSHKQLVPSTEQFLETTRQSSIKLPGISTPRIARPAIENEQLKSALQKIKKQKNKLKIIKQKNIRLVKHIKSLRNLVKHLQEGTSISEKANILIVN